jgi:DNA-binding beta-propeller fold protein YncE
MRVCTSPLPLALAVLLAWPASGVIHAAQGEYQKIGDVHIGGAGAFDYLTVDSTARRLYVTHGTEIVVVDLGTNTVVGRIAGTPRVHGIAIGPDGRGFTSNGGENKVGIVDLTSLQTLSKVEAGANPDAILYSPLSGEVYAFNHTGESATVIDAKSGTVTATIPLGGAAESGQADPGLKRVFVNLEDTNAVAVIDMTTHKVVGNWPVAPASEPTGMAIDPAGHALFIGGGGFMVKMDATSGKVLASVPICGGTDATTFDPQTRTAFASCSDGHITAVHDDGPGKLTVQQTITTTRGARTMAVDPRTHNLYTAAQDYGPGAPVPDSFHVLIYGVR